MPSLTFYPLGNADCCRLSLAGGEQVLFDYGNERNPNDPTDKRCDLNVEIRKDMKRAKRDVFDVVAYTHLDNDHVCGSENMFYLEHAAKYQEGDRLKITELWVPAAAIIEDGCEDSARIIRAEARHRLKNGAGIKVFSRPELLEKWLKENKLTIESRKHLIVDAGQIVPTFNLTAHGVEFFVHSPFASRLDDGGLIDRNSDSIVVQATFVVGGKDTRVILGSDVKYQDLEEMVRITQYHNRPERLQWDVFKLPHHCSYKAIGPDRGTEKTEPTEKTKWLYETQRCVNALMVSTSWPIPVADSQDDDDQPPHRQAAAYHRTHTPGNKFKVTMEHPSIDAPEKLVIEIDGTKARYVIGPVGGPAIVVSQPAPRMG
jgi:hypothetical protein